MKKILIVNNNLRIGGVQKALVSLLWSIRRQYDITLLLFHPEGALMKELPPGVNVITPDSGYRYLGMSRQDTVRGKDRLGRSFYAAMTRVFGRKYATMLMGIGQKKLGGYDTAVAYLHNAGDKAFLGGCCEFVLNHVSAKRKIAFLHCDYGLSGANTSYNNRLYAGFDTIAACSQGCADSFVKVNPELVDKVAVVPNCHRFEKIWALAEKAPVVMDPGKINLLTVARLGKEKSVERALDVIAGLGNLKERIHYYIVGDGSGRARLLESLNNEGLASCVTLCGQLENPYGYMHAADLLLIPSRSEAAPLVIGESACLGTPILSMKTSSAEEMIADTGFGWVCENDVESMTEALKKLIREPEHLRERSWELKGWVFSNAEAVSRFQEYLE